MSKRMSTQQWRLVLAALSTAILPLSLEAQTPTTPAPAAKEEVSAEDEIELQPFIVSTEKDFGYRAGNSVSATRVQTAIKDLPFAMNAYTEEFIKDLNTQDLYDVLRFAPNVSNASNDFGNGDLRFNLRGFSTNISMRNGLQGVRNSSLNNIARVEVVKGPASVLYGQVAPGGIINWITKKPLEKNYSEVRATIGNQNTYRGEIDVTGPLSKKDGLFYRLSSAYMDYDRVMKPFNQKRYSVAPSLQWNLFGKKDITLSLDYEKYYSYENPQAWAYPNTPVWGYEIDNAGNLSYASFPSGPRPEKGGNAPFNYDLPDDYNQANNSDFRQIRIENAVAELNMKLPFNFSLRAASSYYKYDTLYVTTGIASLFNSGGFVTAPSTSDPRNATNRPILTTEVLRTNPNGSIVYKPVYNPDGSIAQLSDNLMQRRLAGEHLMGITRRHQVDLYRSFDFSFAKVRLMMGIDWQSSWFFYKAARVRDANWTNITWNLKDPSTWNRTNQWDNSVVTDLLNLHANPALPATSVNQTTSYSEGTGALSVGKYVLTRVGFLDDRIMVLGGVRSNEIKQTPNVLVNTPQAGITGKVTKEIAVYGSYSEAFIPNNGNKLIDGVASGPLDPTFGKGYDIGVKMDLFQGKVSTAISYFKTENTGIVTQIPRFNSQGQLVISTDQGSTQESSGIEIDGTVQLSRSWKAYLSYGHQNPRIKEQKDRPWMVGSQLDDSAKDTASLQTRYDIKTGQLKGLFFGGGWTYTGTKIQRSSVQSKLPISRDPVTNAIINPAGNGPAYQFTADPYSLVNLFTGYNFTVGKYSYTVQGNISNLFDTFYMPSNLSRGDSRRYSMTFTLRR